MLMSEKIKVCEVCDEHLATVLCPECCTCYCDKCCETAHKGTYIEDHRTEAIPEGVTVDGMCPHHKGEHLWLFCVNDIELCCTACRDGEMHGGHMVVNVPEIGEDNEIFSAEEVRERFADALKRDDELDSKIEAVMEGIRSKGNDVREMISQTFMEAHKRLEEEEAKIMEELERVCNESEEALQRNLEELREIHERSVALGEICAKREEEECSRLMELNLVSSMERQRRELEEFHGVAMSDVEFSWDSEERSLTVAKALFNGAPVPSNVCCQGVLNNEMTVSWDCDLSRLSESDFSNVSYVLSMKEPYESAWKEVYAGEDDQRRVDGLKEDTEYDVCVVCAIGELRGRRSDVVRVRTKRTPRIDSISFPQISVNEIDMSWECDESCMSDVERAFLRYEVRLKKVGAAEWTKVYDGPAKKQRIDKLEEGTEYDFSVRCVVRDLQGEWNTAMGIRTRMVPTPRNITFPRVSRREIKVSWECDESKMYEDDREKLMYVVSLNKAVEDKWKDVWFGKERSHVITGLEIDTDYFLCVGCNAGKLRGEWSPTAKVRTASFDLTTESFILRGEANRKLFAEKLVEWCKTKDLDLLYRGSRDGFAASDFHRMCDNKGKTLVLVKDTNGYVSGGFATVPWTCSDRGSRAPGTFIFTLTNMYRTGPTRFLLKKGEDGRAVQHYARHGPLFGAGCDYGITSNCNEKSSCIANFPNSFVDTTGYGKNIFSGKTISRHFQVKEIEVFSVNV